jgi:hypothetical protein
MAGAKDSSFSPALALPVGSLVVPTTSAGFGNCCSEAGWGYSWFSKAGWGCSWFSRSSWCCPSGFGASRGCSGSSGAPSSPACPKTLVCRPGADVVGACNSGTTLSAMVCSRTYCSTMAVFGGGSVAPPNSSSSLWVDVELYKSMTNNKGDDINQLFSTLTSSRRLTGLYSGIRWRTEISSPSRAWHPSLPLGQWSGLASPRHF